MARNPTAGKADFPDRPAAFALYFTAPWFSDPGDAEIRCMAPFAAAVPAARRAQDGAGAAGQTAVPPPVDTITPVPPPENPVRLAGRDEPAMPKNLKINNYGAAPSRATTKPACASAARVKINGDNGMEIFADSAVLDFKAKTVTSRATSASIRETSCSAASGRSIITNGNSSMPAACAPRWIRSCWKPASSPSRNADGKQVYVGDDAGITTHDVEDPNYLDPREEDDDLSGRQDRFQQPARSMPATRRCSGCPI